MKAWWLVVVWCSPYDTTCGEPDYTGHFALEADCAAEQARQWGAWKAVARLERRNIITVCLPVPLGR